MSLAKTALRAARPRAVYFSGVQRRNASSESHGHDEHHSADAASYPKEGWMSCNDVSYCPPDIRDIAQGLHRLAGRTPLLLRWGLLAFTNLRRAQRKIIMLPATFRTTLHPVALGPARMAGT
jgi:hypothetical protein